MSNRMPVPLKEKRGRILQVGRIRIGHKNERGFPQKLRHFRLTSQFKEPLEQLAAKYGGDVQPFDDPKSTDTWELYTETAVLDVALPPDPLEGTFYELWGGRGAERRCDGQTVTLQGDGNNNPDQQMNCLCLREGVMKCAEVTRLSVFFPDIAPAGFWRLDTKGILSAEEIRGMVETLQMLQQRGITIGQLHLSWRQSRGGSREFPVVQLLANASMVEIAAGATQADFVSTAYEIEAGDPIVDVETGEVTASSGQESVREIEAGGSAAARADADDAPTRGAAPPEAANAAEQLLATVDALAVDDATTISYDNVALYLYDRYEVQLLDDDLPGDDAERFVAYASKIAADDLLNLIERIGVNSEKFVKVATDTAKEQRKAREEAAEKEALF